MFPLLRKTQHEFNIPYPRMKLPTHDNPSSIIYDIVTNTLSLWHNRLTSFMFFNALPLFRLEDKKIINQFCQIGLDCKRNVWEQWKVAIFALGNSKVFLVSFCASVTAWAKILDRLQGVFKEWAQGLAQANKQMQGTDPPPPPLLQSILLGRLWRKHVVKPIK